MFRKKYILLLLVIISCLAFFLFDNKKANTPQQKDTPMTVDIATFDSGFGGFFTAKEIEKSSHHILKTHNTKINISHFGDTKNAPYGERTPEQIADLTTKGVMNALDNGADMVFIACNTASTQYHVVQQEIIKKYPDRKSDVVSIIDVSVQEVKKQLDKRLINSDTVHFAVLATPATIKSQTYLKALAKIYNGTLHAEPLLPVTQDRWFKTAGKKIDSFTGKATIILANNKKIHIYQLAPANWVDLIEKEGTIADKHRIVNRDLKLLENLVPNTTKLDGLGEFCTHYPVFDKLIQSRLETTQKVKDNGFFIKQGPLMANIFEQKMFEKLKNHKRTHPINTDSVEFKKLSQDARANIVISGDNIDATKRLARTIFPQDAEPLVEKAMDTNPNILKQSQ